MLQPQEEVAFLDTDNKEHPGVVLGSEAEYFWLLVPALGNVYQGHPGTIASLPDRKVFWLHDRCQATKALFDEKGQFSSDIFWCAKDPKSMVDLLCTYRLIGAYGL